MFVKQKQEIKTKLAKKLNNGIYSPIYTITPGSEYPKLFNEFGDPVELFFIRDIHTAHGPYGISKYFLWDRYNYALKTHMYTHNAMLETLGTPDRKFGMLGESRAIVPDDYNIFKKHKGLEKEFDAIFTFDDEILNSVENAKFFPCAATVWYGRNYDGIITPDRYLHKTKNISIVSSDKEACELHRVRKDMARACKKNGWADAFGTFDGGQGINIEDSLRDYRYSIVIENDISDYFFTERITNCFMSQTIPIYIGARKIDEFFNADGIIRIEPGDVNDLENVLKKCTVEYYNERTEAILDNFNRVQEYTNSDDWLYLHYLKSN